MPLFLGEDGPVGEPAPGPAPPHLRIVRGGREDERGAGAPSVLLVEDDPSMRMLCAFNLEAAGFRVITAATGEEGLDAAMTQDFDVLLLDVMLPDLGGFELAQELRAGGREVPVVFVSARTSPADLAQGRAAGAIDYVTKPFDPVQLADRLREDLAELGRGGADAVWQLRFGRSSER